MCLENIIGLSNTQCDCISNDDNDLSFSGYFINDILEAGTILKLDQSLNCDDPIWDVYKAARTKAIDDFKTNIIGMISEYSSKVVEWEGFVGNVEKASKVITNAPSVLDFPINPRMAYKATKITITPGFKGADVGTVVVRLFNINSITPLKEWVLNTTVGGQVYGQESITIPAFTNGIPNNYKLQVTLNGVRPFETKTYCCSGPARWNNFVDLPQKQMNGLIVKMKLHCGTDWICGEWDYDNDPWAKTMAKTILLMSRTSIYKYILSSGKVNKYTLLLEPEHLMGKIKNLNKEVEERMNYLSQNIPAPAQDCWQCNQNIQMGSINV